MLAERRNFASEIIHFHKYKNTGIQLVLYPKALKSEH